MLDTERVLVVVGDDATRESLSASVGELGYPVTVVSSAEAAEQAALADVTPLVVVVDCHLEGAPEVCARIRDQAAERFRLIALCSAEDTAISEARTLGANDVVYAPFFADDVAARVAREMSAMGMQRELTQRADDLRVLVELSRELASTHDAEAMLYDLVTRLAETIGVPRCSLVIFDEEKGRGTVLVSSDDQSMHDLKVNITDYPEIGEVIRTKQRLIVEDVGTHPLLEGARETLKAQGIGTIAIFPLLFEQQIVGVLILRRGDEDTFTEREISFAATVAHATAVSLRNARLFERITAESQRETEQRIRVERQVEDLRQFEDLYEHVAEGILIVDAELKITGLNPSALEILEPEGSLRGVPLKVLGKSPEDQRELERLMEGSPGEAERTAEVGIDTSSGDKMLSLGASPLTGGGAVVSFRDVTEARRTAEELRKTTDFLANLIDSSADAIVATDMDGKLVLWNKAAERVTGYSREEVSKLHVSKIYPDDRAYLVMERLRGEDDGGPGRVESLRETLVSKEGERIPVSLSAAILYEDGKEVGTMGIFTDLRDRLRIERKLTRAQDKLVRSEKQAILAELAGTTAHELNQPLTSVMGYAELLKRKIPPEDPNYRAVDIIFRESERMAEIVRKIGRITRYETKEYLGSTRMLDLEKAAKEDL